MELVGLEATTSSLRIQRVKSDGETAYTQACASFAAHVRAHLQKALMKITSILIDAGARSSVSVNNVVELHLGEKTEIRSTVQIDMGPHPDHHVAVVILPGDGMRANL
ncbi:MAG TPA: hypothetical protein VE178_06120 [Silvibacterium sp.]|nr:hypothetical protein [Silvibacterium sp.]